MLPSPSNRGSRIAAFDGGGINVLSELIMVWELMLRIQALYNLSELPLPCDFFDLICGTGTGGLVAILLGRLRLTINQAIDCYVEILNRGFVKKGFGMGFGTEVFSATVLERVLGEIVARHCGRADARMIEGTDQENSCKVMVCAMSANAIRGGMPTCIRTYRVSANQGPDCTIVEALRATMATPGMFKRITINEQSIKMGYVGGGLGCNNPTARMLGEAEILFPGRPIATVLSFGSGQLHSASVPDRRGLSRFLPSKLVETLESIASDCEKTNQELSPRFQHTPNVYFRFNAEQGMQDIDQSDIARLPDVQAHTRNYLQDAAVTVNMNNAVKAIGAGVGAVKILEGNIQALRQPSLRIGRCPPPSRVFTGREDILEQMRVYFFDTSQTERRLFVLSGLGGAGKTQLALKFVNEHRDHFWDVFYIDATTRETISAGLIALAKAANAGSTPEEALSWLVSQEERWLLVFNNADDPTLKLQEFFPACTHGDILITTRNQQLRAHTHGPGSYCRVSGMLADDALKLILRASGAGEEENAVSIATQLVKDFGFFALAIVQSGAYIRATECGLAKYSKIFQGARERLLKDHTVHQTEDYPSSVYASWDISYRQLSPHSTQLLHIMSFMHHEGISETIFEVASVRAVSYKPDIPLSESQSATQAVILDFLSLLRNSSDEWDLLALQDLTHNLRSFSLLDYDTHSSTYSMHPLVQEWCRSAVPNATSVRECSAWLLSLCVNWEYDAGNYALRRQLLPHLVALDSGRTQFAPDLAFKLSLVYVEAGYYKQDEALTAIALQGSRDTLGNEHSQTLACMNNLAVALRAQGKSEEAAALLTEVIEIKKRVLGQEHPSTLTSMYVLARTYHDQKRWQEAEALLLEVIEARKRVIGVEHNHTLKSMGQLASTYWSQGRLSEAEALEVEVLETMQRVLGREHPDTLATMHNLAATYEEQGKLREAESLMEDTVALRKKVLGESHPETNTSVGYLEHIQRRMQSELGSSIS